MKIIHWFFGVFSVIFILLGLSLIVGGIWPQPEHIPKLDGTLVGYMRDSQNWIFGVFMVIAGILYFVIAILPFAEMRDKKHAQRKAWEISKKAWYVQANLCNEWGGLLRLSSVGTPVEEVMLAFRPAHPNIAELSSLGKLSHVRLSYTGEVTGEWGLESEVTTYLRLKEANSLK